MAKFGDHALHCLAFSFLNMIRKAGRQKFHFSDLRIQYLAFGNYFVVLNAIFGFGSAKIIL